MGIHTKRYSRFQHWSEKKSGTMPSVICTTYKLNNPRNLIFSRSQAKIWLGNLTSDSNQFASTRGMWYTAVLLGCRCLLAAPAGCVCYACAEAAAVVKDQEHKLTLPEQEPVTPAAVEPILTEVAEQQPIAKEISEPQPIVTEPVVHEQEKPESTRPVKMVQLCEVEEAPKHPPSPGEYLRL